MDTLFGMFSRKKKNVEGANDKNAENEKEKVSQSNNPEDEIHFIVTFIGDSAIGAKSSFIVRYVKGTFSDPICPTIGAAFLTKDLVIRGKKVKMEICDTAGQERFRSLLPVCLRHATGVVLGYDITNRGSFVDVRSFYYEINCPNAVLMLIGNKVDLEAERKVSYEEGEELAREFDVPLFFEGKSQARTFQLICCYFYFYFSLSENRVQRQ